MDCENTKADAFEQKSNIKIGNKVYIVERHFTGGRDICEAIYTLLENEAFHAQ